MVSTSTFLLEGQVVYATKFSDLLWYLLGRTFAYSVPYSIRVNISQSSPLVYWTERQKMHLINASTGLYSYYNKYKQLLDDFRY